MSVSVRAWLKVGECGQTLTETFFVCNGKITLFCLRRLGGEEPPAALVSGPLRTLLKQGS